MKSMKRIFTLIMALACMGMTVFAQAPTKINYQVVARDADNAVLQEQPVSVQIDILQGSATGTSVYTETLNTTTNFDGLLSLEVNAGEIDWANGPYFIQTTVEGNVISTVQLMAVPYAFYAAKTATDFSGKYEDLKNKPEIPVIPTKTSEYDNDVPYVTKEAQELSIDGDKLTISDGNTVDLPTANKVEYIPVKKPKTGDMLYWDNDKQEWVLIQGGKAGDVLAYFEKPEWAAMDEEGKITQKEPESGCGTIVDHEGNEYGTVIIGTKCWMTENMRAKSYPDGRQLVKVEFGKAQPTPNSSTRYYFEHTDDVIGTEVFYPWATVTDRTGNQTNQDAIIRSICPEGWHVPTYKQFADMCNVVDPDWNRGAMSTGSGQSTLNSNNKLAIKLANPDVIWRNYTLNSAYQDEGVYNEANAAASITVVNSPGYNYMNNISDPDANASGFNAIPKGYCKENSSKVHYYYNGCLVLWTAIGSSATGAARTVKIASDCTGILHQSWGSTAKEGYSVRCVSDADYTE